MFAANGLPAILEALQQGGLPQGNLASLPSPALAGNMIGALPPSTPQMLSPFMPQQVIMEALRGLAVNSSGPQGYTGRPGGSAIPGAAAAASGY